MSLTFGTYAEFFLPILFKMVPNGVLSKNAYYSIKFE